jgi:rhodanese-related sulfurtransferase
MESSCFLLTDETGKEVALFSGDTLFLGDVGRPDLAQKAANKTQEELAGLLYESLMHQIMPLPDSVIIYPAHGAGSACGKNMMKETMDTLGHQKAMNYALNQPDKNSFIKAVTEGLTKPPGYFGMNVMMNKTGYSSFDSVLKNGLRLLSISEFETAATEAGALILDTRDASVFAKGYIPGSINIGLNGDFAPWVGALIIEVKQPIILVTDPGKEEETVTRLSRVGFDNLLGYLNGGFAAWKNSSKETDSVNRIPASRFEKEFAENNSKVFDVRKESEYEKEHIKDAVNKPLSEINEWIKNIHSGEHFYIHCAAGYRSMIAASILQARGYRNFTEIEGGYKAISETGVPKSESVFKT